MACMRLLKWLLVLLVLLQLPCLYSLRESYQVRRYLEEFPREDGYTTAPFQDLRGAIHVHRAAGGQSLATYPEIIQAAKEEGYHYIFFAEPPNTELPCGRIQDPDLVTIYGHEEGRGESFRILSSGADEVTFVTHLKGSANPSGFTGLELFNLRESALEQSSWYQQVKFLYNNWFFPGLSFFHVWTLDPERFRLWDNFRQKHPLTGICR